jgi:hypothetical protein
MLYTTERQHLIGEQREGALALTVVLDILTTNTIVAVPPAIPGSSFNVKVLKAPQEHAQAGIEFLYPETAAVLLLMVV